MLVRTVVAAAVSAMLNRTTRSDNKGKATTSMHPYPSRLGYGSVSQSDRRSSYSGSRSGDRLDSVPEQGIMNDRLSDYNGEPSTWNNEEECSESCSEEDEDEWTETRYDYKRTTRLYVIVPVASVLFFLFTALLPKLIAAQPLPTAPSTIQLMLCIILSASLWCLSHSLRITLYFTLKVICPQISTCFSKLLRSNPHSTEAAIDSWVSIIHVFLFAFLQELLRVASFPILNLHWYQVEGPPSTLHHPRARDAAFHEVWNLALGWAVAEVCAGIVQGYEQLSLYSEMYTIEQNSQNSPKSSDGALEEGASKGVLNDGVGVDLMRRSLPCVEVADDEDIEAAKTMTQSEIDSALVRLANIRARDELEALYGQPYIEIPVFVAVLQRLDSLLLSLGTTLLLAAAYLPKPPSSSSLLSEPSPSILSHPGTHTHMLPLVPTFFIVAIVHSLLGLLHAPPILPRLGIPAAAYTSCIVGLALAFAGVGVWVGVW